MILEISSDSPALVRYAASAVLYLHIGAGMFGIASGATALILRKGGRSHRTVGNVFFVSMMIMSAIGAAVSPFLPKPQWVNVFMGVFTFYLVSTSWMTVRRKEGQVGYFEVVAFSVAASVALAALVAGTLAANTSTGEIDGLPFQVAYGFAVMWALIAIADFRMLSRGGVAGRQRITRHLWRMGLALLVAVGSLFLGQPKLFPDAVRGTGILFVPVIAVLGSLLFWIARVRFGKGWSRNRIEKSSMSSKLRPVVE
ncbi:MAG TPA: hypothetical protein VK629_22145 [Steroidobacteraceae bacterium]|nr:hypothetical protein [Steroidobacteraceae bacterium]